MKKITALALCLSLVPAFAFADGHGLKKRQMDPAKREAFKECASEAGFQKGDKPSKEQREQMKACLKEKGIEKADHKKFKKHKKDRKNKKAPAVTE